MEDSSSSTGLVYTLTLSSASTSAVTVTINLTGTASTADYYTALTSALHTGSITSGADYTLSGTTLTVTIPAGTTSVSLLVDPSMEGNTAAFVAEGSETLIATIASATNATLGSTTSATGVIYDGNPTAISNLDGDITLKYGLETSTLSSDRGYTVSTADGSPILTTNYGDTLYIGYYQDGTATTSYGNIASSLDGGADAAKADGNASLTTVDMGAGDDTIKLRGNILANVRVYLGEGADTFYIDGSNNAMLATSSSSYVFAEAGDDKIYVATNSTSSATATNTDQGNYYLGSGSDTIVFGDATYDKSFVFSGTLDTGSGASMPSAYLSTYQDGSGLSLGNDTNTDASTDVNNVTIYGSLAGTITGGAGSEVISITNAMYGATITSGLGDDTIVVSGKFGADAYTTSISAGDGNDSITLGSFQSSYGTGGGTVDAGAGNDTITISQSLDATSSFKQTYLNGGDGTDTLSIKGTSTVYVEAQTYLGGKEGIANIENFDMTLDSTNAQTVKVTASSVLSTGVSTIYIAGNSSDYVDIDSSLTKTSTTTTATALDGTTHTYTAYTGTASGTAITVYIDNNMVNTSNHII